MIARRLAPVRFALCASPGYVKQHGAPREPDDLSNHRCLFYSLRAIPGQWRFIGPEGEVALRISGRLRSNNGNMLYEAMLAGAGIGLAPTFVVGKDLAEGRLVSLMPDYKPVESELSAIYPLGKSPSAKVRSLIDFSRGKPKNDERLSSDNTRRPHAGIGDMNSSDDQTSTLFRRGSNRLT